MRPLIVGEAPSKNGDPTKPVEGRIGKRLATMCGLSPEQFYDAFDRMNLLQVDHPIKDSDYEWDLGLAATWSKEPFKRDLMILLGKRVARAFGLREVYFLEQKIGQAKAYVIPHPSGLNRWWNEDVNIRTISDFMRKICHDNLPMVR